LARNVDQAAILKEAGADEIVVGDIGDPAAIADGLRGADLVYHICPNVHPEEVAIGRQLLTLAEAGGVRRLVFHSVLQPGIRAMPHHWAKRSVEIMLRGSDLDFTVLQPAPYMQNVLGQSPSLRRDGVYSVPYNPATRVSMVDLEDVAEAAARVLTNEGHSGATYELCSPGLLDQTGIAAALGSALGRDVRAEAVDRGEWAERAVAAGMARQQIDTLLAMFRYYERFGMVGSAAALEQLLGRPATTFSLFVERTLGSGRRAVPSELCNRR